MISTKKAISLSHASSVLLAAIVASSAFAAPFAHAAVPEEPAWCRPDCRGIVSDWSLTAYAVIRAADGYTNPMAAARVLAAMHIAMHDAANAAGGHYPTRAKLRVSKETTRTEIRPRHRSPDGSPT